MKALKTFKSFPSVAQHAVLFLCAMAAVLAVAFAVGYLEIDGDTLLSCLICILMVAFGIVAYCLRDAADAHDR